MDAVFKGGTLKEGEIIVGPATAGGCEDAMGVHYAHKPTAT